MNKDNKKNNRIIYITIVFAVIALVLFGTIFFLFKSGKLNFNSKESDTKEVELKKTEKVTVKSDGVYITDVSEVVDKVMPSIVSITSKTVISSGRYGYNSGGYITQGAGSGVIVEENDKEIFILTNYHVVEDTTELSVKFIDNESYDASVRGISERKDIAIVTIEKNKIKNETLKSIRVATLGDSNELKVGNGIIAIGNALGYGQSVTTGVVSALNREVTTDKYTQNMIQIDAAINGGNSGGALLNSKGEVVGINSVKYSQKVSSSSASIEGMGFAIPISDVKTLIEQLIKGENDTSDNLTLGIEGYMTTSQEMAAYRLPTGIYVSSITPGSNASKSELEVGDIITQIDNIEITSIDSIKKVLNQKEKGSKVTLKIKYISRNEYKDKDVIVTLN
ncbi:MAG: trypsin-like peptidase domain-containing protein [Bacilli bacterium]|nr:trypsin-like peptidase domain-containing protein [Bacilli bacterium]